MSTDNNRIDSLDEHFDVLREISNIGSGNAATALAKLLNRKVEVGIPQVSFLNFHEISDQVGGPDAILVGLLLNISGDVNGMMMFLLSMESTSVLIKAMLGNEREEDDYNFSEMERSLIQEIGNIVAGSYLSSLATLTNLKILPSIPYTAIDMAAALLSMPASQFAIISDKALFIESKIASDENHESGEVSGFIILIPDIESYDIILRSLGVY